MLLALCITVYVIPAVFTLRRVVGNFDDNDDLGMLFFNFILGFIAGVIWPLTIIPVYWFAYGTPQFLSDAHPKLVQLLAAKSPEQKTEEKENVLEKQRKKKFDFKHGLLTQSLELNIIDQTTYREEVAQLLDEYRSSC